MKKTLLAMGTAAALTLGAVAAARATASAAPWGWHGRPFGHFGRFWGGPRIGFGFGVGSGAFAFGGSCSRVHRVWTPFGWRWRRIWVC